MCGRYTLVDVDDIKKHFDKKPPMQYELGPRYNFGPAQKAPIVIAGSDEFVFMHWGLVPFWAKDVKVGYSMINAKAETLAEKPSYKGLLKANRCLVPASGFYEWKVTDDGKQPYYFTLKDRETFAFAGLWTTRKDAEGNDFPSYTIITTQPNELLAEVHDRMPVILSRDEEKAWLDPDMTDPADILAFLNPYPANEMDSYPVSKDVGSVKNDRADLIKPVA